MPYKDPIKARESARNRQKTYRAKNLAKARTRCNEYKAKNKVKCKQGRDRYVAKNREKLNAKQRAYRAKNKENFIKLNSEWRAANPDKMRVYYQRQKEGFKRNPQPLRESQKKYRMANRDKTLERIYGITRDEWTRIFTAQGECCAVCKTKEPGSKGFHTDHCHKTKKVRGILCHKCNLMLGLAKDNIIILRVAIDYLKEVAA